MPMEISSDTTGKRIRDLPADSAVAQPNAPPAAYPRLMKLMKAFPIPGIGNVCG